MSLTAIQEGRDAAEALEQGHPAGRTRSNTASQRSARLLCVLLYPANSISLFET